MQNLTHSLSLSLSDWKSGSFDSDVFSILWRGRILWIDEYMNKIFCSLSRFVFVRMFFDWKNDFDTTKQLSVRLQISNFQNSIMSEKIEKQISIAIEIDVREDF